MLQKNGHDITGETAQKTLSNRTHECPHCKTVLDRDENAALNILSKALSTVGHTGTNAWGENDLCLDLGTAVDKLARC